MDSNEYMTKRFRDNETLQRYSPIFASFGWQKMSAEEVVDSVEVKTKGSNSSYGYGFGNANINDYGSMTNVSGNAWGYGSGSQSVDSKTKVNTVLNVTFRRDTARPGYARIKELEDRFWAIDSKTSMGVDDAALQNRCRYAAENLVYGAVRGPVQGSSVNELWLAHGCVRYGRKRKYDTPYFKLHFKAIVHNRQGVNLQAAVTFMDSGGAPLRDKDNRDTDLRGNVGAVCFFKPSYEHNVSSGELYLEFKDMHLKNGRHALKYLITVTDLTDDSIVCMSEVRELAVVRHGRKIRSTDTYPKVPEALTAEREQAVYRRKTMLKRTVGLSVKTILLAALTVGLLYLAKYFFISAKENLPVGRTVSSILLNGAPVSLDAYAIGDSNYVRLRDIASALSGTPKRFGLSYNAAKDRITILPGAAYASAGSTSVSGGEAPKVDYYFAFIYVNKRPVFLDAYEINESVYVQLRALAKVLDFSVSWDGAADAIAIDTAQAYQKG